MLTLEAKTRVLDEVAKLIQLGEINPVSVDTTDEQDFAEPVDTTGDRDFADHYTSQAVTAVGLDDWLTPVRQLLSNSSSLEEARDKLFGLYSDLSPGDFAEVMGAAIAAAELAGRYEVLREGQDTPEFSDAMEVLESVDRSTPEDFEEPSLEEAIAILERIDGGNAVGDPQD